MPHNYTLTSLIQTNDMLWKNGATLRFAWSTPFSLICLLHLLHIELMLNPLYTLSVIPLLCLTHRCCLGAGIPSIHCCVITFGHVMNLCRGKVWVRRDCFPAPSPRGRRRVGSCSNRSVWHVQIHRTWWKECYDAKRDAVTNSSIMCLCRLFLGTGSQTNLSLFPWNFLTSAVRWKIHWQKVCKSI